MKRQVVTRFCGGFTLIEIALAMLALSLGVVAIFGLSRLGTHAGRETLNEQRCAMLADAIFETLRERNGYYMALARTNEQGLTWHQCWERSIESSNPDFLIKFPPVAHIDIAPNTSYLVCTSYDSPNVALAYNPAALSLANWNPRYYLAMAPYNYSHIAWDYDSWQVLLGIHPEGDTLSSDMRIYSTILVNSGGLP